MEIYISINGVLRNFIQKFHYLYEKDYIDVDSEEEKQDDFEYQVSSLIMNDDLTKYFKFHSKEEFNNFAYIEYPLELFGHSNVSYPSVVNDLNKLIYTYKEHNFTLIGVDEFGKSKPSTLFFLSKNGFLGNNIKFISSEDIKNEWKKCDVWVTDDEKILNLCPKNKMGIHFMTDYNRYFYFINSHQINNINEIEELCLKSWVKNITSISTRSLKNAVRYIFQRKTKKLQTTD